MMCIFTTSDCMCIFTPYLLSYLSHTHIIYIYIYICVVSIFSNDLFRQGIPDSGHARGEKESA